jgi:hypothetical protein
MGMNNRGQLGDGTTTNRASPVKLATTASALVAAGDQHSLIVEPLAQSRLLNLSTRGLAQSGDNQLIPGFVVSGTASKQLLIRAVGPTLASFGIGSPVPDPAMILKRLNPATNAYVDFATNDNWRDNSNAAAITSTASGVGAFALASNNEAALLVSVPPGQYTVPAGDRNGTSGIAIVEIYDADAATIDSRLTNISNRGFCGVGDQVMIPGFVVSSEAPKTLLVRVVGPTLATFGVTGTMTDPKLDLFRFNSATGRSELVTTQDNWSTAPDSAYTATIAGQVGAFALPAGSRDAALVVAVGPGSYTVVGSSVDGRSTGVLLVEIYVVP